MCPVYSVTHLPGSGPPSLPPPLPSPSTGEGPPARSPRAQIDRFEAFQHSYNHDRPHEALGPRPPITAYRRSPRPWDGRLREPGYGGDVEVRRVRSNGEIKWHGDLVFLSETLSG